MIDRCYPPHSDQTVSAAFRSLCFLLAALLVFTHALAVADDSPGHGVQAPPGFEVTLFADDEAAPDIYSLTIDAAGRVVVASRGYVRVLVDQNEDGIAETARQFADGPANGSMGMSWDGADLICTGDAGLLRYRDEDQDGRADGPPEVLLAAKTGGEHDIHAIRKGPDGWWYLIGGNNAGLDERYVTLPASPVTSPKAGALIRLAPDFAGSEVIGDGFRNPYDFAFDSRGDLYAYDSDGERDVSLPWYRPTRVFQVLPGSHAGWVSRSWKRPGRFFDMPPVVASLGRGSPTGVECYRHTQFPDKYRGGLFVLDWTYGRVMFVPLTDDGSVSTSAPEEFLTGTGQFGFAPTDAAVAPDGSLYVSVGGRGTRGGVYRVRWPNEAATWPHGEELDQCLRAPQPLSSWSRSRWEPLARKLGAAAFRSAALDEQRLPAERVRAIEILTDHFSGLTTQDAQRLASDSSALVRGRAAWSLGRLASDDPAATIAAASTYLADADPFVVRAALEAVLNALPAQSVTTSTSLDRDALSATASSPDRYVRQTAARVLARLDERSLNEMASKIDPADWRGAITLGYADVRRTSGVSRAALKTGHRLIQSNVPVMARCDAARLIQLSLGDVGPGTDHPPVYDGYASLTDLGELREELASLRSTIVNRFPTGDQTLDRELSRLIAILQPTEPAALENVLAQITADSHPVDDVHHLIVASRLSARRSSDETGHIAQALLAIDTKIDERGLHRDLNWDDRIGEMYAALVSHDARLPETVVAHPAFGDPGHVLYVTDAPRELREQAVAAFIDRIRSDPDYQWTSEIVLLLGESKDAGVRELLRAQAENFAVQSAVLVTLAEQPRPEERSLFISGLESADLDVLRKAVAALKTLGPHNNAPEQVVLVRTLRRLDTGDVERNLKRRIIDLLEQNTGHAFAETVRQRSSAPAAQDQRIALWSGWVEQHYPDEWAKQTGADAADLDGLQDQLANVDWSSGDAGRGERLFVSRSCSQCHGGRRALGPDLNGVAGRFSREDLFTAIVLPNRDVSPRYQTTLIITDEGQVHTGIVIYESIDGLLLRNSRGETVRIEADEIDTRNTLTTSIMPGGLLNDLQASDLSDLYAYLQSLK